MPLPRAARARHAAPGLLSLDTREFSLNALR
jgi:hypothetical protein